MASNRDLLSNQALQQPVEARLQDLRILQDTTWEVGDDGQVIKTVKCKISGCSRTTQDFVVKEVDWPHFHVHRTDSRKPAAYNDLSIQEFVYGYLKKVEKEKDGSTKLLMAGHLQELMQDALEFTLENLRKFDGVFLEQCETR